MSSLEAGCWVKCESRGGTLAHFVVMRRVLSHPMYQLDGFTKSTSPQKRQLIVLIGNSKQ
jgi:hypothetical protein